MTRPMPTAPEAEEAVLAIVLRSPDAIHTIPFLRGADFANAMIGPVYDAVRDLNAAGRPSDWRSIAALFEGRAEKAGSWFQSLIHLAPPETELQGIARSVRDLADRRRMIVMAEEMLEASHAGGKPAAELAATYAAQLAGDVGADDEDLLSAGQIAERVHGSLKVDLPCSTTGFPTLDEILEGGLYAGKLYGLIARMKAGKTVLMSSIALAAAEGGSPVAYLPLEMGAQELCQRILARKIGCNSLAFLDRYKRKSSDFDAAVAKAAVGLGGLPLFFQNRPRMHLDSIRQTIARAAMRRGIRGVIVDYLQLITGQGRSQSTAAFLDEVTQTLAEAAKSWGIWILVAAQENQTGGVRSGEGLLNACDVTLRLNKVDPVADGRASHAWVEMIVSRYTQLRNLGSAEDPMLRLDTRAGPAFVEVEKWAVDPRTGEIR